MNPDRHASSHYDYFRDLIKGDESSAETHRKFYDEYNAVLDMDADYYLETIKTVFQDFSLPNGTWDVRSPKGKLERVRPQDIKTTALLTIEGELDDISGSGQTEAAHDLCTHVERGEQHHMEVKGAGHYGIFSGRRWRTVVYPHVRDFIAQHTTAQIHGEKWVPLQEGLGGSAAPASSQKAADKLAQPGTGSAVVAIPASKAARRPRAAAAAKKAPAKKTAAAPAKPAAAPARKAPASKKRPAKA